MSDHMTPVSPSSLKEKSTGREVTYQSASLGLGSHRKTIRHPDGTVETVPITQSKPKKWHNKILSQLAACIEPIRGVDSANPPLPVPIMKPTGQVPATKFLRSEELDSDDSDETEEWFDAIDADDEDVNDRTRPLHEALARAGALPSRRAAAKQWWDSRLTRPNGELYEHDFMSGFVVRMDPSFEGVYPKGAVVATNKDTADHVLHFETEGFKGRVTFRSQTCAKDPRCGDTAYFKGRKRLFSLQIQGRFKEVPEHPDDMKMAALLTGDINIPWFAPKVIGLIKQRDPNILIDLDQRPIAIGGGQVRLAMRFAEHANVGGEMCEWQWGEDVVLLEKDSADEKSSSRIAEERRGNFDKWQAEHFKDGFKEDKNYSFDIFNSYVDFPTMSLTFGFLSFPLGQFFDHLPITMRAYNGKTGTTYWAIQLCWRKGCTDSQIYGVEVPK